MFVPARDIFVLMISIKCSALGSNEPRAKLEHDRTDTAGSQCDD